VPISLLLEGVRQGQH